jgi:hypothetical protein
MRGPLVTHPRRRVSTFLLAVLVSLVVAGCESDADRKAVMDSLVRNGANEQEAVKQLGKPAAIYQRGTPEWKHLENFLANNPPTEQGPLREGAAKYPRILTYSTHSLATWVFLDEQGVVRGYWLATQ